MNQKLMVVSWAIYPSPTGSSVIVSNIASQFSKATMVLFGENVPDLDQSEWSPEFPVINYIDPNIRLRGRGQKYFRWLKISNAIKRIKEIALTENCTAILAIFPDEFYVYAAYKVSKDLNIPLYTWFHNTYLDNRSGILRQFAKWFQPLVFKHAKTNFVMSDGMNDFYKKRYPDQKFETLVHGFDIPIVNYREKEKKKAKVKFLFTGSLNESCLDASIRLFKTIISNPNFELHLFTGNPEAEFQQYGITGQNVIYHGFIALKDLEKKFEEFDIMLLPHGFDGNRTDVEYQTIFPTRTIPALYSNLPILAHSPKDVFLTDFLKKHKCAEIVDEKNEKEIERSIDKLLNDKKYTEFIIKNALETSNMFDVSNVVKKLKNVIFNEN